MPKRRPLTVKQERFATHMADPKIPSQTEAARRAGYAETGAHVAGSLTIRNPKVRALIRQKEQSRADKARAIYDLSMDHVAGHLENTPDPMFALAAAKTTHEIAQTMPDEVQPLSMDTSTRILISQRLRSRLLGAYAAVERLQADASLQCVRRWERMLARVEGRPMPPRQIEAP